MPRSVEAKVNACRCDCSADIRNSSILAPVQQVCSLRCAVSLSSSSPSEAFRPRSVSLQNSYAHKEHEHSMDLSDMYQRSKCPSAETKLPHS